jgi:hypothetical protein
VALYRLEARIIGRTGGHLAGAAASYRSGGRVSVVSAAAYRSAGRLTHRDAGDRARCRTFDYSNKPGVVHTDILVPADAPEWSRDRQTLWQAVEDAERRRDAQLARELLLTLPRDVPLRESVSAAKAFVDRECVSLGMVADVCVHGYGAPLDPKHPAQGARLAEILEPGWPIYDLPRGRRLPEAPPDGPHAWRLDDGRLLVFQPHVHVLLTLRPLSTDGRFANKAREWSSKRQLYAWRESWERSVNRMLAGAGRRERVSAKAKWKREADAARERDGEAGVAATKISRSPREADLGGGYHASLAGRPPVSRSASTETRETPAMAPSDFNAQLRALRTVADEKDARIAAAMKRVTQLQSEGVRFVRTEKGGLGFHDPRGLVTPEDRRLWSGLHETVLRLLESQRAAIRAQPSADERLSHAYRTLDRLIAAGVIFGRTAKGGLGYTDPNGAMTKHDWRAFSGLHGAMLEELERRHAKAASSEGHRKEREAAEAERERLRQERDAARERASRAERALATLRQAFANLAAWWMRKMSIRASETERRYREGLDAAGVADAGALDQALSQIDPTHRASDGPISSRPSSPSRSREGGEDRA